MRRIALDLLGRRAAQGPHEGHHLPDFCRWEPVARHLGIGNAVFDDRKHGLIVRGMRQAGPRQSCTTSAFTARAMAVRTLRAVNPRAGGEISLRRWRRLSPRYR